MTQSCANDELYVTITKELWENEVANRLVRTIYPVLADTVWGVD